MTTGTLAYQAIGVRHAPHAERGNMIERRSGRRAATTFRKLPTARPGRTAKAASTAPIGLPRLSGGAPGQTRGRCGLRHARRGGVREVGRDEDLRPVVRGTVAGGA